MTLEEMKYKVYSMIEEYNEEADNLTDDDDLATKFNGVCNQIQNELARLKKINAYTERNVSKGDIIEFNTIDNNFYQINTLKGIMCDVIGDRIECEEDGILKIYYYKLPEQITQDTEDSYEFELDTDALEVAVLGIAGLLLASDVSSNYGQTYYSRYQEALNKLDPRNNLGMAYFEGGLEF